jgi:hypothetical protein
VSNGHSNDVSILSGNGNGSFSQPVNYLTGLFLGPLAVGDFNGDQAPDLAVVNNMANGSVSILLNQPAATHFQLSAPANATAGTAFNITVTAVAQSGATATGYTGTVHFTSSDTMAVLPADYTFTATDAGVHTFSGVMLKKSGTQTVSVADTVNTGVTGSATVSVKAAAATHLTLTPSTKTPKVGTPFTITITALDAFGNKATGYRGTIHFTNSDAAAVLPANYTFVSGDKGKHTFSVTLNTVGKQTITATDIAHSTIKGTTSVTVGRTVDLLGDGERQPLWELSLLDTFFAGPTWKKRGAWINSP